MDHFGSLGTNMDHFGSFELFGIILDHIGSFGTIWDHLGPFQQFLGANTVVFWVHMVVCWENTVVF